jgi:hypothetical protein
VPKLYPSFPLVEKSTSEQDQRGVAETLAQIEQIKEILRRSDLPLIAFNEVAAIHRHNMMCIMTADMEKRQDERDKKIQEIVRLETGAEQTHGCGLPRNVAGYQPLPYGLSLTAEAPLIQMSDEQLEEELKRARERADQRARSAR